MFFPRNVITPEDKGGTMKRREFLTVAAVSSLAVTGCLHADEDEPDEGEGTGDPETTVRSFIEALDAGDAEAVNALIHPDGEVPPLSEGDAEQFGQADWTVEETEITDQTDETATVRSRLTIGIPVPDSEPQTEDVEWELRLRDGEWLVWDGGPGAPGGAA